ncbi:DUF4253 domain-containing protein [uncultured Sphingomonas sp.]|uniref:DUF4253 domain-containing protein n=1 Tax=uncultured Sphingomonas sp. TaxID=158754 RepID=UPI0025E19A1B|nr:DUF4253 domain-containing protein [uncultured Sphingomonas sp.]
MTRRTILRRLGGLIAATIGMTRASSASAPATAPTAPLDLDTKAKAAQSRVPADLPYPRITVPGDRALAEWERLRSAGRGWPVIVGGDEQLAAIAEQYSLDDPAPTPEAILKQAATLRMPADLAKWDGTDDWRDPPLGTWPTHPTKGAGLTVASDILTGKPHPQVHILLIPTTQSWEVPAYLRWGNWNACPPPAWHVAALKQWHDHYGVELIGLDGATLNLRAARRPTDRTAALALTREQYLYCPDVIDQGVESLSALAAILMADDWWFFWWD